MNIARFFLFFAWLSIYTASLAETDTTQLDRPSIEEPAGECSRIDNYVVTKLSDDGSPGTLRHAAHVNGRSEALNLKKSCRNITFNVQGNIRFEAPFFIRSDFITIDGCSAPGTGITFTQNPEAPYGIVIDGTHRHTHDVRLACLRFKGVYKTLQRHQVGEAMLSIDGDCASTKKPCPPEWEISDPVGGVSHVTLDRLIYAEATDKLTLWGKVRQASITRSLFYHNPLALLVSYYGGPTDLEKRDISITANIFAENNERNPQLRGWINGIDIRHNLIVDWDAFPPLNGFNVVRGDGYGIRIKNLPSERSVNGNIVGNIFTAEPGIQSRALIYGIQPGHDQDDGGSAQCLPQGQLYEQSKMGKLFISNNLLPIKNCDQFSTVSNPFPTPLPLETMSMSALCKLLPIQVGVPALTQEEKLLLLRVQQKCLARLNAHLAESATRDYQ